MQETSLNAYEKDVLPTLGERQWEVFKALQKRDNFTNSELAAHLNWPINTVVPRVYELRKAGQVFEDVRRTCRVTGRRVIAWSVSKKTLF